MKIAPAVMETKNVRKKSNNWQSWMSQLLTSEERWSAVVSFMVASWEMALSD